MAVKKRYFTKDKKKVGKKSGKPRGKYNVANKVTAEQVVLLGQPTSEQKSPNNSRSITELAPRFLMSRWKVPWKRGGVIAGVAIACGVVLWQVAAVSVRGQQLYHVLTERAQMQSDMRLWESIASQYPAYRDADFQVAILAYRLHDVATARTYLRKVLALDPNYQPGLQLEKQVGK